MKNADVARQDPRLMHDPRIVSLRLVYRPGCSCRWTLASDRPHAGLWESCEARELQGIALWDSRLNPHAQSVGGYDIPPLPQNARCPAQRGSRRPDGAPGRCRSEDEIGLGRMLIFCFRNQLTAGYSDRNARVGSTAAARREGG